VTFGEVPIGHVFKFMNWGCACLFRKTGETSYRIAHVCNNDLQALEVGLGEGWPIESDLPVLYDPFVAELEAMS
jgi:hypothetical protein